MTIVNGSLPFFQNYMKIHQDPTRKCVPPRCHMKFKGYPVKCVPHAATWILHGIYGSVIAEADKKHYDSDVHKRG